MATQFDAQFPDVAETIEKMEEERQRGLVRSLHRTLASQELASAARSAGAEHVPFSKVLRIVRHSWAEGLLAAHHGNETQAAKDGGIHRNTLHRMAHKG